MSIEKVTRVLLDYIDDAFICERKELFWPTEFAINGIADEEQALVGLFRLRDEGYLSSDAMLYCSRGHASGPIPFVDVAELARLTCFDCSDDGIESLADNASLRFALTSERKAELDARMTRKNALRAASSSRDCHPVAS